jgi:hypothetical protein
MPPAEDAAVQSIITRLAALRSLARPLALTFGGVVALSLGIAYLLAYSYRVIALPPVFYYMMLQFLPLWVRGLLSLALGCVLLGLGIWRLSGVAVIQLDARSTTGEMVLGYTRTAAPPQVTVISGGAGLLIPASLGRSVARMTCVIPVQDPVEYYYRASSLFSFTNVVFVAPTIEPIPVLLTLDDGGVHDVAENISHREDLAARHVVDVALARPPTPTPTAVLGALRGADVIILGPGSLFESIIPTLAIPEVREALAARRARTIYICSLMTEPGMTHGFGVADHIRQFRRFAGFVPDYVLVNAQRIDPEVQRIYAAAHQSPVTLSPEEYEETVVPAMERVTTRDVMVEGSIVVEADVASSVVQLTASLDRPGESRTVRVLRHDPDKLIAAVQEIIRRG